jgi:hypothetical protein
MSDDKRTSTLFFVTFCCTIETNKGSFKSCIMRTCGKENARLISNALRKEIGGKKEKVYIFAWERRRILYKYQAHEVKK